MARRFTRGNGRSRPRSTFWLRSDAASGGAIFKTLVGSACVLDQFISTSTVDETIVRTRGSLVIQSDQNAASEEPFGAYGVAIVSEQARAIGPTAIPCPYTDADSDKWLVHGYWAAPLLFGSAIGSQNVSQRFEFDSKAMRKIVPGEEVVFMLEDASVHGAKYTLNFAMLFKTSS